MSQPMDEVELAEAKAEAERKAKLAEKEKARNEKYTEDKARETFEKQEDYVLHFFKVSRLMLFVLFFVR